MVHFCQSMIDLILAADVIKDVLERRCVLFAIGELNAVVCEKRMDLVGRCRGEIAQESSRNHLSCLLVSFDIGELGCAIYGHERRI